MHGNGKVWEMSWQVSGGRGVNLKNWQDFLYYIDINNTELFDFLTKALFVAFSKWKAACNC